MIMLCHILMTVNPKYKNNVELYKHCNVPHLSIGEQVLHFNVIVHFDLHTLNRIIVNMYF